jgi:hypothetical protein
VQYAYATSAYVRLVFLTQAMTRLPQSHKLVAAAGRCASVAARLSGIIPPKSAFDPQGDISGTPAYPERPSLVSSSRNENHRRFHLDEKFVVGEAWHADPSGARRLVAEHRLEGATDRLAFVHVALSDVES